MVETTTMFNFGSYLLSIYRPRRIEIYIHRGRILPLSLRTLSVFTQNNIDHSQQLTIIIIILIHSSTISKGKQYYNSPGFICYQSSTCVKEHYNSSHLDPALANICKICSQVIILYRIDQLINIHYCDNNV